MFECDQKDVIKSGFSFISKSWIKLISRQNASVKLFTAVGQWAKENIPMDYLSLQILFVTSWDSAL